MASETHRMKKHSAILFANLCTLAMHAQPTITNSVCPAVGDEFLNHFTDAALATPATGANVSWDYSAAVFDQSTTGQYVAPDAGAPAGTTVMDVGTSGISVYYQTSAAAFSVLGSGGSFLTMDCSDPQANLLFPLTMGSTGNDAFSCSGTTFGFGFTRAGSTQFNAVGYGTLTLPYGTFSNVLLVAIHQTYTDDMASTALNDVEYTTDGYFFLKPGVKSVLLASSTITQVAEDGQTNSAEQSQMLDESAVGVQEALAQQIGMELWPNPAQGSVEVVCGVMAAGAMQLAILDGNGRTVLDRSGQLTAPGIRKETLDLAGLAPGVYLVRVADGQGAVGMKRLVVQ